jgi:hypothetical protein
MSTALLLGHLGVTGPDSARGGESWLAQDDADVAVTARMSGAGILHARRLSLSRMESKDKLAVPGSRPRSLNALYR